MPKVRPLVVGMNRGRRLHLLRALSAPLPLLARLPRSPATHGRPMILLPGFLRPRHGNMPENSIVLPITMARLPRTSLSLRHLVREDMRRIGSSRLTPTGPRKSHREEYIHLVRGGGPARPHHLLQRSQLGSSLCRPEHLPRLLLPRSLALHRHLMSGIRTPDDRL